VRFTIERLRTLVLLAGVLLLAATVAFLAVGKWKNPFNRRDLPQRLGLNIQQESNGVTFSHAMGAHSQFKIHASKVVQLKQGNALLHDVRIELYGEDGSRVDRIEGNEFEYNQKDGTATATGPVEITLMRPGVAPAIAPKAAPDKALGDKGNPLNTAARAAAAGEVKVRTNGLAFNWNTGIAATAQHVDFSTAQGAGSAMGATYDSKEGHLVLDRDVELRTQRAGEAVAIHASHAEFERGDMACHLRAATADYRGGQASAEDARLEFRANGSVVRLDATGGFRLTTENGGKLEAARGGMEFDEHNQPRHGRMEGGVTMDSAAPGRKAHGTAPSAELEFTPQGNLRHAHLEKGVELNSEEEGRTAGAHPEPLRVHRIWRSSIADVEFRAVGRGQVEPAALHGAGGVAVGSQSQRGNAAPVLARLAADQVESAFGPNSALSQMTGAGHATMEQTTASGARQTATGDRLEAHFIPASAQGSAVEVQSAVLDGHVVLVQTPPAKAGAQPQPPLRAFAGRAAYASDGQWLHLTINPRVEDGGLQLTATKIDISQESGDAYAHGNVKATWTQNGKPGQAMGGLSPDSQEPAHVIAAEAQVHQAIGNSDSVATFRGHARLWQQANSVAAPTIVLEKDKQVLEAHSTDRAEPVRVALLSEAGKSEGKPSSATPSVLRVRGGDLRYSGESRVALMQSGSLGSVVAETATATSQSDQVELKLLQAAASHTARPAGQGQVERMTARGRVTLSSQGRRGTGEQLVYTGATGEYVLTGTATAPPRMTDPAQGSVTGAALIFHSRDDSVSIEGGGRSTTTRTTAPR
jgi:lipopolysaccharide export system protein LptA